MWFGLKMYIILFLICVGCFHAHATYKCETKVKPIGCFKDKTDDRALPTQLINERDVTSKVHNGRLIEWLSTSYLPGFVCRCARKAKSLGFMYFGIQFYGECWSGTKSHVTYNKHGKSSNCAPYNQNSPPNCHFESGKANANYIYKVIDRQCETEFGPLGCFRDSMKAPRPLPNYAMNERDRSASTWNGYLIDWHNWNSYLPQLICRCAQVAKDFGDDIFSIQYYGECWTGKKNNGANYLRDGKSNKCIGENYKPCNCYDYHCAGMQKVNFVYQLKEMSDVVARDVLPYHYQSRYTYHGYPEYKDNGYFHKYVKQHSKRSAEYE